MAFRPGHGLAIILIKQLEHAGIALDDVQYLPRAQALGQTFNDLSDHSQLTKPLIIFCMALQQVTP